MAKEEKELGITAKKDADFSDWYTQVVAKAELADYTSVSGCMVLRPNSYAVWENIQKIFDAKIKKTGHKNAYFPLLIPEKLFKKESEHVEGFSPEVAWVTQAGDEKLSERLAIRPTSETIICESYAKWVRSWRDLPVLINQWCNVVRWEFKYPKPFLRTREFLWQEGHTLHATQEEAEKEVIDILKEYKDLVESYLAIPVMIGKKSEKEKFAGAVYTTSMEALMPDGKALQMGTSHYLGQNFAKAFGISFLGKDGKQQTPHQTSWGISTRLIGGLIMTHSDDKGLVLPPKIAPTQIVIVPIVFDKTKEKVLKEAADIKKKLEKKFSVILDERDEYNPGWKFNDWEMKGVPLRIELGPKDLEKSQVVLVRRDNGRKEEVKIKEVEKEAEKLLDEIQEALFKKALDFTKKNTVEASDWKSFEKAIKENKLVYSWFCCDKKCEEGLKEKTQATSRVIPFEQQKKQGSCVHCGKTASCKAYFGRSY